MTDPVLICLDSIDVLKLIMGHDVLVRHGGAEYKISSGGNLWKMQQKYATRLAGKVHVQAKLPKKDYQ